MSGPTSEDRLMRALRALIHEERPEAFYSGVFEYSVQGVDGNVLELEPTDATLRLPATRASMVPSLLGERVTPAVGSKVLVAFINSNPTRPIVIGGDPNRTPDVASLGTAGNSAVEHVTTTEAVTNVVACVLVQLGLMSAPGGAAGAAALATALLALTTPALAQVPVSAAVTLAATGAGTLTAPTLVALLAALAAKGDDPTGLQPGVGCPNLKAG